MKLLLVLSVAVVLLAAACTDSSGETTTSTVRSTLAPRTTSLPPTTAVTTTTVVAQPSDLRIPDQLAGMELTTISLDDVPLTVAVADTPELRRSGLMFVEDLEDLNGMLFIFDADTSGGFWMKNTLLRLDIAFFDVDGRFVDGFVMEPCTTAECATYFPEGRYRYALEMEARTMPQDPQELTLHLWADEAEEG